MAPVHFSGRRPGARSRRPHFVPDYAGVAGAPDVGPSGFNVEDGRASGLDLLRVLQPER